MALEHNDGDRWAAVIVQPADNAQHAELAVRLKSAGLKHPNAREWNAGLWPPTRCTITVTSGHLTQMHTGRSRVLCAEPLRVTESWATATARGRVVLGLVPPGTWPDDTEEGEQDPEERGRLVEAAAQARQLLTGLAEVRDTPEPYGRRW
jgi:hypothetical protein